MTPRSGAVGQVNGPAVLEAASEDLGLFLSDSQIDHLVAYAELLQRWNKTYNLTSVREPSEVYARHLNDCLSVIGPLRRVRGERELTRLLDAGSGGGLPGVVIAILEPSLQVTCVDAVRKKAAFVQQVRTALTLGNLESVHARVENLRAAPPYDLVSSRAFTSLAHFTQCTDHLLALDGIWMAMKGKDPAVEVNGLPFGTKAFHVEQLHVPGLDAERHLVWMRR